MLTMVAELPDRTIAAHLHVYDDEYGSGNAIVNIAQTVNWIRHDRGP